MKLRNPVLIKVLSLPISWLLRLWLGTLTYRVRFDDPSAAPDVSARGRRFIYLFWHEMILFPTYTHVSRRVAMLVSHHADGELMAQIIRMLGGISIRGSTSKRGLTAIRNMLRRSRAGHIAVTPDGPRGPRRVVQQGAVYVASRTGLAIVPVGLAYARCRRHRSWDRMALPTPGSLAQAVVGRPIVIPPGIEREELERHRRVVQRAMDDAQARAERMLGLEAEAPAARTPRIEPDREQEVAA